MSKLKVYDDNVKFGRSRKEKPLNAIKHIILNSLN